MTFCTFSKDEVVWKYKRAVGARNKKMTLRVLCDLTLSSEKEMIEFLKGAGVYEREKQTSSV